VGGLASVGYWKTVSSSSLPTPSLHKSHHVADGSVRSLHSAPATTPPPPPSPRHHHHITTNRGGAELVSLPECWNSPYATSSFPIYAEPVPSVGEACDPKRSPSTAMMMQTAKDLGIYLIGGSIPASCCASPPPPSPPHTHTHTYTHAHASSPVDPVFYLSVSLSLSPTPLVCWCALAALSHPPWMLVRASGTLPPPV
jgi:hypothetical protein